jgi:hypothetical protein
VTRYGGELITVNFEAVAPGQSQLRIQGLKFLQADEASIIVEAPTETLTVVRARGQILGAFTTISGKPIRDATVEAFLEGVRVGTSAKTNLRGRYLIDDIYQVGLVEVRATAPGILPLPSLKNVEVNIGQKTVLVQKYTMLNLCREN